MDGTDRTLVEEAFSDVEAHREVTRLVKAHSTAGRDVRDVALEGLELSSCRSVLDIGCGFGFFTEALAGRVSRGTLATGIDRVAAYRRLYLETCSRAGLEGRFLHGDASRVRELPGESIDLVLCSYALYFFPEEIPAIARVLAPGGRFVAITHDRDNMRELVELAREGASEPGVQAAGTPLETILGGFSSETAAVRLREWFREVRSRPYSNALRFGPGDTEGLRRYLAFKAPLLATGGERVLERMARHALEGVRAREGFVITKNDTVFVCSGPRLEEPRATGARA